MGKSKWVAVILGTISVAQLGIGVYMPVWGALNPGKYFRCPMYSRALELRKGFLAEPAPPIPLDTYHSCFISSEKIPAIMRMTLSLAFGRRFVTLLNPHSSK